MGEEIIKVPKDIFHPLSTLHWTEYIPDFTYEEKYNGFDMVVLEDRVYVYTIDSYDLHCAPLADLRTWSKLTHPPGIYKSTLTTYQSQLVLIGGVNSEGEAINDVWTSADGNSWQSLPPMLTSRCKPTAVSCVNPECLIVYQDTMEVLVQGEWLQVGLTDQLKLDLPKYRDGKIHNGNLYVFSHPRVSEFQCHFCKVEALLTSCIQTSEAPEGYLWHTFEFPPHDVVLLFSFQRYLLAITSDFMKLLKITVYVYSTRTKSWVAMEESGYKIFSHCMFASATYGTDHILLGAYTGIYSAELQVLPHIPNRKLSEGALLALELVGVPVLSSLPMEKDKQLAAAIGAQYTSDSEVLEEWLSGGISSTLPPTWRSLYEVLRELDMEELSQQIEEYLSCPRSLKEQCTSTLLTVLLQHSSLKPDQLQVRLPDYIPPRDKRLITDAFSMATRAPSIH